MTPDFAKSVSVFQVIVSGYMIISVASLMMHRLIFFNVFYVFCFVKLNTIFGTEPCIQLVYTLSPSLHSIRWVLVLYDALLPDFLPFPLPFPSSLESNISRSADTNSHSGLCYQTDKVGCLA